MLTYFIRRRIEGSKTIIFGGQGNIKNHDLIWLSKTKLRKESFRSLRSLI